MRGQKTHVYREAGMIASIRGQKTRVYRVIILKQMADHENRCCSALVHFILNGNQG